MEDYKNVGLMQLRIYARSIGVKSPTVYTKKELLEKIERIEKGLDKPYQSNRGRPTTNERKLTNEKFSIEIKKDDTFLKSKKQINSRYIKVKAKKEVNKKIKEIKQMTREYLNSLNKILNN